MRHCPNPDCDSRRRYGFAPEYVDGIVACTSCGTRLAPGPAPSQEPAEWRELVVVYEADTGIKAHLLRGILEGEGIPARIIGEALAGATGELPIPFGDIRVLVPPEHAQRARDLARDWEQGRLAE